MTKASRFLDTSLKVSELKHREEVFEQELDREIAELENDQQREEANSNARTS